MNYFNYLQMKEFIETENQKAKLRKKIGGSVKAHKKLRNDK